MDFQLEYKMDEQNKCWDVTLSGEIDLFNSADFKIKLTELLNEKALHLWLRCKKLEYIDSTGLGALVGVLKTVKSNGHEMHLIDVRPNFLKMLKITNLDNVFQIKEGDNARN